MEQPNPYKPKYLAPSSLDAIDRRGIMFPKPPELPPLVSFHGSVTKAIDVRFPSTWRMGIGKQLTNRRIAEYQREGVYGSGLKLPPIYTAEVCCVKGCNSRVNTRKCDYGYLPKPGVYCIVHRRKYREAASKEKELAKELNDKVKAKVLEEYV